MTKMTQLLRDFPPGPLDYYRKRATFDWKKLRLFIDGEEGVKYEETLCNTLRVHPEFKISSEPPKSRSFNEERRIAARQSEALRKLEIISLPYLLEDLARPAIYNRVVLQFTPSSYIKHSVGNRLFTSVIQSLGTDRHYHMLDDAADGKVFGCFCLTEIGHGTNTKGMRTTATYDKNGKQFIMNSPDFEAAKCWAGGLGQLATHAVVFAQLYVDNVHHGLHTFVVPIRNPENLKPYPGIRVGDMGEKIGLNGIDNGYLMFQNYRIPRENILNKTGDVTEDGRFVTRFKDARSRHGTTLGALSMGRVSITGLCENYLIKALTIAIRYGAVRKQFGPEGQAEIPVLEYETHQHRLLPFLASAYALRVFSMWLSTVGWQFSIDSIVGNNKESLPDLGMEIHAISSASKPVAAWTSRQAIQECRETCAGHGYLKISGIGDIRNDNDANCTYEGENHVLIQQTTNWLLKFWPVIQNRGAISTPFKSADFLSSGLNILNHKFQARNLQEVCAPQNILDGFQWLVVYYLRETRNKAEKLAAQGKDEFWVKNNIQVYYGKSLGIAFIQHFILVKMLDKIEGTSEPELRNILTKLFSLHGLFILETFLGTLYEGGYAANTDAGKLIKEGILYLCGELKNDSVALIDSIAPQDFILNSAMGASDGQVYKRMESLILDNPELSRRPDWWQEVVCVDDNIKSKL